jgi:DnaJ-class molecular chaperone
MRNFYEFLDISETATDAEITAAFRRWMRLCHPDKAPPAAKDQAMTLAKIIEHAYSTLKDAEKRKAYDVELKRWRESQLPPKPQAPPQPPQPPQAVSSSIFGDIAGSVWKQMTGAATEAIQDAAADAVSKVAEKLRKKKGTK